APSRYGALLTLAPPRHARGSGDPVVAPERHEVAVEVIAQRDDLGLEAAAQLAHETFIWLGRIRHHNAPLQDLLGALAQALGGQRLHRRPREPSRRPLPKRNR